MYINKSLTSKFFLLSSYSFSLAIELPFNWFTLSTRLRSPHIHKPQKTSFYHLLFSKCYRNVLHNVFIRLFLILSWLLCSLTQSIILLCHIKLILLVTFSTQHLVPQNVAD